MSYKEKPQLKLYKYENSAFVLQAIIDDYQEVSFERNLYQAGTFTISINYNIPNALLFERGLFIQFGNDPYDFGEIYVIQDEIGNDGKGSQVRTITGYDARYILKRRVIKNMNSNGLWVMTAKGEICLRELIKAQCGTGAEAKRQLPITNTIPTSENAIGKEYSVSEQFTNLYEVCTTIATQAEVGWRLKFDGTLTLECYEGTDRSASVRFDTNYESLANGEFTDSSESFSNAIYVGGKGQNDDRDIYEGENGTPSGFDRFESWDNQSAMTVESEYEAEALSMLTQYGQTIQMSGNGLAKCPYEYKNQYNVGDLITVAFSGRSAVVQILSVTEHWAWNSYDIQFSFGKPQNNLAEQLQLILRKIQSASNKESSTDSVRWYTIPTDSSMPKADVTYNTIGFKGTVGTNATFTLYLDNERTGAKTYHVYFKQLDGTGKLTLTTGKSGASNLVMNAGTYVAIIYVDENGNVSMAGASTTTTIEAGNKQPVSSEGVKTLVGSLSASSVGGSGKYISAISETDGVISATASDIADDLVPSKLYDDVDLNTLTDFGIYRVRYVNQSATDLHFPYANYGILIVARATGNIGQVFIPDTYSHIYKRYFSTSWSSWVEFLNRDDIATTVTSGNTNPVSSNAVYNVFQTTNVYDYIPLLKVNRVHIDIGNVDSVTAELLQQYLGNTIGGGFTIVDIDGRYKNIATMFCNCVATYNSANVYAFGICISFYQKLQQFRLNNGTWSLWT